MILQAVETFNIVRQLSDHTDGTTYYVRAVIRNSITGDIIATVNLTDKTNRRFVGSWQVASDPSNMGMYIDITTSVYTDSGYTTKAPNYGDDNNQYLVVNNRNLSTGGGGSGGGSDIDYKKIKKIMDTAVKAIEIPEYPETEKVSFDEVNSRLDALRTLVEGIEMPEKEETDYSPILTAISELEAKVKTMVDEKETDQDMTDVIEGLQDINDSIKSLGDEVKENVDGVKTEITTGLDKISGIMEVTPNVENLKEFNQNVPDLIYEMKKARNNKMPEPAIPAGPSKEDISLNRAKKLLGTE